MNRVGLVSFLFLSGHLLNGCSSGNSTPPPPPATHFSLSSSESAIAGVPFNVNVIAVSATGSSVVTYSGTVHFTSSDPQAVLPADSTITNGVGNFSVTLKTAGNQRITAADTLNASITGVSNTILVGPAKGATHFAVTVPESAAAGTAFNITVAVLDASNNTVVGYSGTLRFTSTDGQAALPANSMLTNGGRTFSVTLKTIGNQSIMATDTVATSITGTSTSIMVMKAGTLALTSLPPPNGAVGEAYGGFHTITSLNCYMNFTGWPLTAAGGTGGYHWSWSAAPASSLPAGLTVSSASTLCVAGASEFTLSALFIGGTPTTAGTYNVIVTVTDSASPPAQATATYSITIIGPASAAAAAKEVSASQQHTRYRLVDLGTLGGPHSYGSVNGDGFQLLNNSGVVTSSAELATPDPNAANGCANPECLQMHAFRWEDGVMTDLGALPVNNNSAGGSINSRGWITGQSQSLTIDPVAGIPEFHAVLWKRGQIIDLGTLDSGTESLGIYVNDASQVVGFSTVNTNSDPVGFLGFPTHTFIWQNGEKLDIGTLGGANAFPGASCSNQPEDTVVGGSTTTTVINPVTGLPDADPFLWHKGKMIDLGTLGGSNGFAQCANDHHQVIGMSSLAANPAACDFPVFNASGAGCHAFFWEDGLMTDLGTLGGDNSEAIWLNEAGEVVGSADLPGLSGDQVHDAVLWKNGKIYDLGTVPGDPCSRGRSLNSRGQVVGGSSDCRNFLHAFLWEEGGPMLDLNTLVEPGTGYQLTNAFNINDKGEILAKAAPLGFTPNDDADLGHLVLLVPCQPADEAGCGNLVDSPTATAAEPAAQKPAASQPPGIQMKNNPMARRFAGHLLPLDHDDIAEPHEPSKLTRIMFGE